MRLFAATLFFGVWAISAQAHDDVLSQAEGALADLGYDPGNLDGIWDEALSDALDNYKRDRGLEPDGDLSLRGFVDLVDEAKVALQVAGGTLVRPFVPKADAPDWPEVLLTEMRVPFHRIEDCRHRYGLGTMFYSEGRSEEFHLTELCFDADGGRLWSAENLSGWTLTNDAPSFQEFKIIEEGVPDWQRHTLMLQPLPETIAQMGLNVPGSGGTGATWFWQVPRDYEPQVGLARLNMAGGVFLDEPQDVEALDGTFNVAISMVHRVVGGQGRPPILPGMGFVGEVKFDGTTGEGTLGPAPNGYLSGESSAEVFLTIGSDVLGGSAVLSGFNGEQARLRETDWKSLALDVAELYGRVDGDGGASIFLIGAADGVAFDQSGRRFELLTAIAVQGFRVQ